MKIILKSISSRSATHYARCLAHGHFIVWKSISLGKFIEPSNCTILVWDSMRELTTQVLFFDAMVFCPKHVLSIVSFVSWKHFLQYFSNDRFPSISHFFVCIYERKFPNEISYAIPLTLFRNMRYGIPLFQHIFHSGPTLTRMVYLESLSRIWGKYIGNGGKKTIITGIYRKRWNIEKSYRVDKNEFLATTKSKSYKFRLLLFLVSVLPCTYGWFLGGIWEILSMQDDGNYLCINSSSQIWEILRMLTGDFMKYRFRIELNN